MFNFLPGDDGGPLTNLCFKWVENTKQSCNVSCIVQCLSLGRFVRPECIPGSQHEALQTQKHSKETWSSGGSEDQA